ncbi:Ceramide_synthetase [Hexamita inflata]|uniref:Ceramide synthetase n=1 Tax=Hexamita inflata TaxID=28002 RepID=A0AA86THF4_9EUKA|nr:Ceramide synthetase [Hexamita inflata]CAI9949354.1 Ceramide synthetase [Hexamita inflata]
MLTLTPANCFILVPPFVVLHMLFRFYFQKAVVNHFKDNKNCKKISESMFYFIQYSLFTVLSTAIIVQNEIWWFNYEHLYIEKITWDSFSPLHATYLMLELAVCISTAITWLFETRKNYADFYMMVVHHACTISLICFCMYSKNFNWGCATANLHDMSDIFLEFSKTIFYLGFDKASKYTFVVFAISFIFPRCYVFPVFMIAPFFNGKLDETLLKLDPNVDLLKAFTKLERKYIPSAFSVLFVLDCIWSVAILNMAWGMFKKKEWKDIREKEAVSKSE